MRLEYSGKTLEWGQKKNAKIWSSLLEACQMWRVAELDIVRWQKWNPKSWNHEQGLELVSEEGPWCSTPRHNMVSLTAQSEVSLLTPASCKNVGQGNIPEVIVYKPPLKLSAVSGMGHCRRGQSKNFAHLHQSPEILETHTRESFLHVLTTGT